MALEFGVLGPVEVRLDGEPIALGGPQQRRILAALVAESGRVVAVDRLVDAVWSDTPPDGGRRTVMTYVSRLRQALGDGYVVTQDPGYRLVAPEDAIDAVRFERLLERARNTPPTQAVSIVDRALELWRGRAFGEFADEWWALPHATRLEELRIVAAEQRAEALIAAGEHDRAVTDLEGLVVGYPLRERFVALLMQAYDASGRQAEALRAFTRYRDYLAEETGLEPSDALRALEGRIVTGDGARTERSMRGYTLGDVLGEGAFGTVYRSTQPGVGREVAIKVIRADLADDPAFVRRFEAEAQLVAHLEHPHIVPLYDFWREPGGAYLVFRLLRGGSAADLLARDGALPLARVQQLVGEIAGALMTAHAAGVVHRDVKPANVLFDEAGNAYLADFGIAAADADAGSADVPFALPSAGSPLYAPPEQFQRAAPSPRGDQYSFAAMVWELLTGRPPFDGERASTILRAKLQRPVPSLAALRPDLPRAVDGVLQRATAASPEARYADMSALIVAWNAALSSANTSTGELDASPARPSRDAAATASELSDLVASPYKGLRAFGEADARDFRGRDALVDRLVDVVEAHAFVAVVGASGSGKSSLVHAGLVPRLRASGRRVVAMLPGDDAVDQLRNALLAAAVRAPDDSGVAAMVRSVAAQAAGELVLVVDQFEELWTLNADDLRESFLAGLTALAADAAPDVRVVVTIRADFFDRPLAHAALGPLVGAAPFAVTPMTAAELHDAVVGPAADLGVVFEPGLDSELVADVADQPASLPMLQFTLAELFERRRGSVITRASYAALGGVAGAIASRAEDLYASLDDDGRDATHRLLLRLVVPGEGTEDTRRRVRYSDLPHGAAAVAERFEAHRLLVADRDPVTREPTVELAHESLLRSWPRLRAWLDEDRDSIRRVQHVGAAAAGWHAAGRPESELYRGGRLDAASELLETRPEQLTALERDFVDASRAAARAAQDRERRARRRLRRGFVATAVALVVALVAGGVALVQKRSADDQAAAALAARHTADRNAEAADVARLVSTAQGLAGTKRDIALLLAVEASRRAPGAATNGALQSTLYSDPSFLGYVRTGTDAGGQISFSPDGRYLYSNPQSDGAPTKRIELATGSVSTIPVPGLDAHTGVYWFLPVDDRSAVFSPYNSQTQTGTQIERIALADGRVLGAASFPPEVSDMAVSPDHRRLAVVTVSRAHLKGRLYVVDLATMRTIASVDQPGPAWSGVPHRNWSGSPVWIDDGRVAVGSPSGRVIIVASSSGAIVQRINDPPAPDRGDASALHVTPDGRTLVIAAGEISALMAYDVATGQARWPRPPATGGSFAIDPRDGVIWAQDSGTGTSRLFAIDLSTGERGASELNGEHGTVCDVRTNPAGDTIAVTSCNEGTIALWALDGRTVASRALASVDWAIGPNVWSPDGHYVALYRPDAPDSVDVVDVRDGSRVHVAGISGYTHSEPFFRRDGILQGVNASNFHVVEYDPTTRVTRDTGAALPRSSEIDAAVELVGEHRTAYGDFDGRITIVDTRSGSVVRTIATDLVHVFGLAWSGDGTRLFAAGQSEQGEVFDARTGRQVATLHPPTADLVMSPDGTLLATGAFNGTVTFLDPNTLRPSGDPLTGATAFPVEMQFTPDGRTLVTSGLDGSLRLFDVASRRQIGVALDITATGAGIAPQSNAIAVTTSRGVQRFAIDTATLVRAACHAAGRNLTVAEWKQYIGGATRRLCTEWPSNGT